MACKHWQGDARDAPPGAFSSDGLGGSMRSRVSQFHVPCSINWLPNKKRGFFFEMLMRSLSLSLDLLLFCDLCSVAAHRPPAVPAPNPSTPCAAVET
jgi:hypothetical protein